MGDRSVLKVASHSDQLSLLQSAGLKMSTGPWAMALAGKVTVGLTSHWPYTSEALRYIRLSAE